MLYSKLVLFSYCDIAYMYYFADLHGIDPVFKKFSSSEKVSGLLHSLGYRRPVIIQSMYIFKVLPFHGEVCEVYNTNVLNRILILKNDIVF